MDRRVRERRQSVHRERGRRRAGVALVLLVVVVAVALFLWLRSSDVFAVQRVTADVVVHVSEKQIAAATAPMRGQNLLALSSAPVEEELAALPYVRSVQVLRRFPHTLHIRLTEHRPAARVRASDGGVWLVTEEGRVLEKRDDVSLPLFVPASDVQPKPGGYLPATVSAALPLTGLLQDPDLVADLPALQRVSVALTGEVVMHLAQKIELRLGVPTELKQKLMVGGTFIQQYLRDGRQIEYVDVGVPDRVAVRAE